MPDFGRAHLTKIHDEKVLFSLILVLNCEANHLSQAREIGCEQKGRSRASLQTVILMERKSKSQRKKEAQARKSGSVDEIVSR